MGAYLEIGHTYSGVNITNGYFDNNFADGLQVSSLANFKFTGGSAMGNGSFDFGGGRGVYLTGVWDVVISNVAFEL